MSIQDLSQLIKVGHGAFRDDPQSGSILKLLGENGFKTKIEEGSTKGRTYTIIHKPPSTEFLLVESWEESGHPRKAYHAFSILTQSTVQTPSAQPLPNPPLQGEGTEQEHPMITYLKQITAEADQLLRLTQKYVSS